MTQKQAGGRPSKRLDILAHATELAADTGPAGFTLDALCERSGISKGGILYHFASVHDLIFAMYIFYLNSKLPHWVEQQLVTLSSNTPDIEQLTIDEFTELLKNSPVEAELERLVIRTLTENAQGLHPFNLLRLKLESATMAQKMAFYSAFGERTAAVFGLHSQSAEPKTAASAHSVNRDFALA